MHPLLPCYTTHLRASRRPRWLSSPAFWVLRTLLEFEIVVITVACNVAPSFLESIHACFSRLLQPLAVCLAASAQAHMAELGHRCLR